MEQRPEKPRGRPTGPRTDENRRQILSAAEKLFAEKGYSAVSVKQIAQAADTNPAMIHYYFGSKHELLREVLERALEPLAQTIASMVHASDAPVSRLARLMIQTFREHPCLPTLVAREVLLPGGEMQEHFAAFLAPRLGGALPGLLAREQENGRVRQDLDPRLGALSLMSLCVFPFLSRSLTEPVLEIAFDEQGLYRLEQHIVRIVDEGFSI